MQDHDNKEPVTMARRFLSFCLAILVGIVSLYFAIQLLSQFWGWLLLLALVIAGVYVTVLAARWRRDRW